LWGGGAGVTNIIQITVNTNNVLGQWSWYGETPTNLVVTIPSDRLVSGANQLMCLAVNGVGAPISEWFVSSFTLSYPRTFTAVNGLIDFTANGNGVVTVDGFSTSNLTLLDVTNPRQPLMVTNLTLDQPAATWRLSFAPAAPTAHYVAWQTGAVVPAHGLALGRVAGLSAGTNGADYVVVAPPSLLSAATNLAAYRRQTGLQTLVAPLDEVYNEFGWGFPTPHAIQALLAAAWTNWSPRPHYLVLLGRGTYDFMNLYQQNDNLTPPLMVSTPFGVFASDSLLGDVNGDGLPEVAVGRLSGLTTNDINGVIDKIMAYERLSPPTAPRAVLIADVPDGAGDYPADILQADAVLTNKFTDTLLFATNTAAASPLAALIAANWNAGVDLVNYAGHGALDQLGTEGYLTAAMVTNSLQNCPRLPVVTVMTCVSGQYSIPGEDCLGECLVRPANGGAIAFFGPTGLSVSGQAAELNVRLTAYLRANAQLALGDLIRQAVTDHVSQDLPTVPVWIYNLLGDPALHYNLARNLAPLQITSITPAGLAWSGGWPPYQVELTTNLSNPAAWHPLGAIEMGYNVPLTNLGPFGFLRIQGRPHP
jgi:hypothetical protein